ncbi:MAG: hypothetical protein VYE27_07995 [Pseudomonadota bacterium]|nr:hypothetical protein [Pseudomonadota bacterium]
MISSGTLKHNLVLTVLFVIIALQSVVYARSYTETICKTDDISKLYEMIYAPLIPFQPPVDGDGAVTASEEEVFMLRSQHYFDQLKAMPEVRIPIETYAVLTGEVPEALLDFETKLRIVLPDCQEISMYNGAPIGKIRTSFETMLAIAEIGINANLEQLTDFAAKSIKPRPITFPDIMKTLSNDLSLNPESITALMPEPIANRYFPGGTIPIANLSEATLLTFAALGGEMDLSAESINPDKVFLVVPKSYSGISESYSSLILTDNGEIIKASALNVSLTAQILVRLGIDVDVLTLKEVITDSEGTCGIDAAGRWFQLIQGRKIRTCPFFTMTEVMFSSRSYLETQDFVDQNTIYSQIDEILIKNTKKSEGSTS